MVVGPVKVFWLFRVTVPLVVLFRAMPAPSSTALTVPLFISKLPVLVSVPVPLIKPPPSNVTVPTVSL